MSATVADLPPLFLRSTADRLTLGLSHRQEAGEAARLAVREFLLPVGLAHHVLFQIELILEETLMNRAWHAFADDAEHQIELDVQVHEERIVMRFIDDGIAFDPTTAIARPLPTSLDDAQPGGLGLMLVRRFAESVSYQRDGQRNILTIGVARA